MTQGGGVRSETELELMLAHQDVIVHREIVLEVCRHTGQHCLAPPVDGAYKPGRPGPPACPAPPPDFAFSSHPPGKGASLPRNG